MVDFETYLVTNNMFICRRNSVFIRYYYCIYTLIKTNMLSAPTSELVTKKANDKISNLFTEKSEFILRINISVFSYNASP